VHRYRLARQRRAAYADLERTATDPHTYLDKIRYKMAYDRNPVLTTISDKVAARGYVGAIVGSEVISTAFAIVDRAQAVDWASLPREFVCKVNHGSGGVLIVWDGADPDYRLPAPDVFVGWARLEVHPDHADVERIRAILNRWLTLDYSWYPGKVAPEWGYRNIARRIMVEELLRAQDETIPFDYRFHVVEGITRLIRVTTPMGRGDYSATSYDRDWNPVPVQLVMGGKPIPFADPPPPLPQHALEMVELSERIARDLDAVRVDLYDLGDRIVFAELTSTPYAGDAYYLPREFDLAMGEPWVLRYGPLATRSGHTRPLATRSGQ